MNRIFDEVDAETEKNKLYAALATIDKDVADKMEEDSRHQAEKQAAKRALLLARRRNKKKHDLEEERVKDKVKLLEEEDEEKEKMDEAYIRSLFENKLGVTETPEQKEKKLALLNEYLSDQFLERMSGLLMKQFMEKEQKMKILLAKYGDQ
jgi:hypothetical protein